jgi:nicotinate dehydrogenase subunit B
MKKSVKNIELSGSKEESGSHNLKRRDFFKLLGGGIIIFVQPWKMFDTIDMPAEQGRSLPKDYNAFLHVGEDGFVTLYTGKIEMGQGIITSLPMEMADELGVPLEKVKIVMGDTDLCPWDAGTYGSQSTQSYGQSMRAAAVEARAVLLYQASAQLGVPVSQLEIKNGIISVTGDPKKTVSYGQLTKGKRIEKFLDAKPPLGDPSKFKYVGKSFKHSDAELKVTGKAKYTGDYKLPGMLFARILRPPAYGAKLKSVDTSAAEKLDGVKVVRDNDFIAVVSENRYKADDAIAKVKAEYSQEDLKINDRNINEYMLKSDTSANTFRSEGDIEKGRKESDKIVESVYYDPFLAHTAMETHSALATIENDKLTVWASTQTPFPLQDRLVREFNMPREKVRVMTPFLGGGFGGKSAVEQAVEAARLTKITGKPVMVIWTREEEFFYDTFHTASVVKVNSGIDKSGKIKFWDYHVYYAGTRGAETIYDVPNIKSVSYSRSRNGAPAHPFSTGPWRAPNANTNTFAREVQIDIMASKAGMDPLEFRLKNLKDERMIGCLKAVADKFGYVPGKTPGGRGIGVACGSDAGTWVAHMVEVKVDTATGKVQVVRIAVAQDMGLCINPEGALIQMEGCITMGLGYTFSEEVKFEGGKILSKGFDSYDIPRFSWLPKMDCIILERKDFPPKGGGEPAIVAIGAVVSNAIFDATGARLYRYPMTPERVIEAIKKI